MKELCVRKYLMWDAVAEWLEHRTDDRGVLNSNPGSLIRRG